MTYSEYMNKFDDPNRTHNYYFADKGIPGKMIDDISEPFFGKDLLHYK